MCGPAAAAFVQLDPLVGVAAAQFCALALGIAATVGASIVFARVDRYAVRLSSRLRRSAADPATTARLALPCGRICEGDEKGVRTAIPSA
jgi:hypothetical protein